MLAKNRVRGLDHCLTKLGCLMKKFLVVICSVVLALGLAGCAGKGKTPIGKGKAPAPVVTKG